MTENKKNDAVDDTVNDAVSDDINKEETLASETLTAQAQIQPQKNSKSNRLAIYLALLALILIIAAIISGVYFYRQNSSLTSQQQAQLKQLNERLAAQITSQSKQSQQLQQVNLQLQQVKNENKLYKTDIQALQRGFAETNVRHPNDWILAEVEYLVTLAGRKIWLERDIVSAIAVLLAADQRVVELSDSSLTPLRTALIEDISLLEALPKRDSEGAVLALSSLERRIDKLVIVELTLAKAPDKSKTEVSTDIGDWQDNLSRSWAAFVESFIVINKRDTQIQALLSPQQRWYLKEKLRNELAKAEFSIFREQQDIYDIALHSIINLLTHYYDLTDPATRLFYKSVKELKTHKVSINYPDQLQSAPLLDRIIKQRVKKSLASSRLNKVD